MIGSSDNRVSYDGNGIATEFAYTFKILEKSNMNVLHVAADGTETLLTKDYYVDMEKSVVLYPGYAPGAEIPESERPPILPVGERLVLYRQVPITQESALDKHWPFNVVENGLDKLTIICQQMWDRLQRSFYVSEATSTNFDTKIPIEAGKTFRVKDDGTGFEVTEDPGKVIDGAKALLVQTTEQANIAVESSTNAQNAANTAEAVAPEYARTKDVLDNIVNYTNTATEQASIATAKAEAATQKADAASMSAANAAQSYANADFVATQLTEYLATKENLTAPAVDKTLLIEGAAADSKVVGKLKSDLNEIHNGITYSNPKISVTSINGKFINGANGEGVGDSESAYVNFTSVNPKTLVKFSNVFLTGSRSICCYDVEKRFKAVLATNTFDKEVVVEIPEDAYYFRATCNVDVTPNIEYVNVIMPDVEEIMENITYANIKIEVKSTDGKFVHGTTGEGVVDSESAITDFIPVVPHSKIVADNCFLTSNRSICCYDINKNFLSTLAAATIKTTVNIVIPDNAYYLRATSRAGQTPTLVYTSIVLEEVEKLKTNMTEITETLSNVSQKCNGLEKEIDAVNTRIDNLDLSDFKTIMEKLNEISVADISNVTECITKVNDVSKVANGDSLGQLKQCVVSFLNDDGSKGQYNDLYPIMSELGVPYSQAIYTGQYDKHTLEMMQNIIALGGDLGSHSVSHPHLMTLTEEELITELKDSKEWFTSQGIPCEYIVYPNGESNDLVRSVAKRYYSFGVSTEDKQNAYPIEDFAIKRITLGAYTAEGKDTYEFYKSKLDEAIKNKTWIVFMLHSNTTDFDATQKQHLRDIIAYARSKNVPIMSMTNAYKIFGNAIKIGDNSTGTSGRGSNSKHFVLSKWGDFSTNIFSWVAPTE